jgi:hypothetical protein
VFKRKPVISSERIDFACRQGQAPATTPQKRRAERDDAYVECLVSTGGRHAEKGVIVDISETGARIRFNHRSTLPETVRLKALRLKLDRPAQVIWRDFNEVGLKFL